MPRYYFDQLDIQKRRDVRGQIFANDTAAIDCASVIARQLPVGPLKFVSVIHKAGHEVTQVFALTDH